MKNPTLGPTVIAFLGLLGCAASNWEAQRTAMLKKQAANQLDCPEGQVVFLRDEGDYRTAQGCGRQASFVWQHERARWVVPHEVHTDKSWIPRK